MERKRRLEKIVLSTLVSAALMTQPVLLVSAEQGTSITQTANNPFIQVKGLDSEDRSKQYEAMKLSPAGWKVGMVLSNEPFAVVTKVDTEGANVRIWTGVLTRELNTLQVFWDEIRVENSGKLDFRVTDELEVVKGYFASSSQEYYRTKVYLGKVPWADIPTDPEAALKGSSVVPAEGSLNVYGIAFKNTNIVISPTLGPVKQEKNIPAQIPTLKKFKETSIAKLPTDAEGHWAKEEILDLMKKSIIEGYEDQTIRPDRTLSKAEFVTLLVKSLGYEPTTTEVSGYTDLGKHWARTFVATAQESGLLDRKTNQLNFGPDSAISRIEMVELINRILSKYGVSVKTEAVSLKDTASLTDANKSALQVVVNAGIVGGYPDGSFRPQGSLTRAEAFKVISRVLNLL